MPFVLDASVAACWLLPDEKTAVAELAKSRLENDTALVPAIWWFEIRNTALMAERRGRVRPEMLASFFDELEVMEICIERLPDGPRLLDVARRGSLTVYDAAYLELAQRAGCPLATLDRHLSAAAQAAGISLL